MATTTKRKAIRLRLTKAAFSRTTCYTDNTGCLVAQALKARFKTDRVLVFSRSVTLKGAHYRMCHDDAIRVVDAHGDRAFDFDTPLPDNFKPFTITLKPA